jgi:hypothetical protein
MRVMACHSASGACLFRARPRGHDIFESSDGEEGWSGYGFGADGNFENQVPTVGKKREAFERVWAHLTNSHTVFFPMSLNLLKQDSTGEDRDVE